MSGRARSARLRYRGSLAGGRGNPVRRTASRRSSPTGTRGRTGTGQAASGTARRAPGGVEHRAVAIGDQAVVIGDQDDAVAAWDLKAAFHRDRAASRWHLDAPGAGRTGCARSGPHWGGGSALRERHAATCGTRRHRASTPGWRSRSPGRRRSRPRNPPTRPAGPRHSSLNIRFPYGGGAGTFWGCASPPQSFWGCAAQPQNGRSASKHIAARQNQRPLLTHRQARPGPGATPRFGMTAFSPPRPGAA